MKQAGWIMGAVMLVLAGCAVTEIERNGTMGKLEVLTEEYPPLNFLQDGKITGQATETVMELMKRVGADEPIRMVPWEEGYGRVLSEPDTALYSISMTPERKGRLQWVGPISVLDTNLYALRGSGIVIRTLEDAKKVGRIATVRDYYSEQILKKEGFANLLSCSGEEEALEKLFKRDVDLYISNNTVMPAVLKKAGKKMQEVDNVFTVSTDMTYIAFSASTSERRVAKWQRKLDEMKQDGTFGAIYARWFPAEIPPGVFQLMSEEYPPVTYLQEGRPAGFVTEMVSEIAASIGIPDSIRISSWKNGYNMALLHPNVVLFSAERTPEREEKFHWVGPVGKNSAMLFAKKGSGTRVENLEDARKIRAIATTTEWFSEQYLKRMGFTNLVSSKDPAENLRQLMDGEVELAVFTDLTIPEIVKKSGYTMADLEPVLTLSETYFYIALSKGTPLERVEEWRSALKKMKEDGRFETIYRSYLPHADVEDLLTQER